MESIILQPASSIKIGDCEFSGQDNLVSIEVPAGIQIIGQGAFSRCPNLKRVILPEGLTKIGCGAFAQCQSLEQINIPSTVQTIEEDAFKMNNSFFSTEIIKGLNITLDGDFQNIDGVVYGEDCKKIFFINNGVDECATPEGLRSLEGRFSGIETLEVIDISKSKITRLVDFEFQNCTELTDIVLNEGLRSIGKSAFNDTRISSISIPKSVLSIEKDAFWGCSKLKEIVLPEKFRDKFNKFTIACSEDDDKYLRLCDKKRLNVTFI